MRVYRTNGFNGFSSVQVAGTPVDRTVRAPKSERKERQAPGPKRRPFDQVRSRFATLSLTPADREFIDGEARRCGKSHTRLLGDVIEAVIKRRLFDDLLGGDE